MLTNRWQPVLTWEYWAEIVAFLGIASLRGLKNGISIRTAPVAALDT
jgi:hypothetical protein